MALIIKTKCPHCKAFTNTSSVFRVRCHNCNRTYEAYPLDQHGRALKSRVVKVVEGTVEQLHKEAFKKIRQEVKE